VEQGGTQTPPRSSKLETLVLLLRYPKFRNAGGGRKPSEIIQKRFWEKISRCNSCADARDLQRHRASESARAREERQKREGKLDERERAGSCDLSTLWPLAHRTWGGRGPLC